MFSTLLSKDRIIFLLVLLPLLPVKCYQISSILEPLNCSQLRQIFFWNNNQFFPRAQLLPKSLKSSHTMDTALEKAQVSQTEDASRNTNSNKDAELDLNDPQKLAGDDASNLRLDKHGLPLVPQPTQHKDDPLVSPSPPSITTSQF